MYLRFRPFATILSAMTNANVATDPATVAHALDSITSTWGRDARADARARKCPMCGARGLSCRDANGYHGVDYCTVSGRHEGE
jgi:hypothetical protein